MKATALLEKQHRVVEHTLKKLESGKGDAVALLKELADVLTAHMAIEQQIFYPSVRAIEGALVASSFEEHALAELALRRLLATSPKDPSFVARVTVLKGIFLTHVEEEEDDLFPSVDEKMDASALDDLGVRMKAMFDEAVERGFEVLLPRSMRTTTADEANVASRPRSHGVHAPAATR